jgi:hypothetical protein
VVARGNLVIEGGNLSRTYAAVGGSSWSLAGTVPKTTIKLPLNLSDTVEPSATVL